MQWPLRQKAKDQPPYPTSNGKTTGGKVTPLYQLYYLITVNLPCAERAVRTKGTPLETFAHEVGFR
eukprot:jgi/Botrbrau1/11971/Bobra.0115s0007.1